MRRKGFTFIEFLVVVMIVCILATIIFPVFNRTHEDSWREQCGSNLKQVGLAILQYSQDYNDKLPPLSNARAGFWTGSVQPYVKSWQVFQCPATKHFQLRTTDYFFNSRLKALDLNKIPFTSKTILLGEGADDSPPNYALPNFPAPWVNDESSPIHRHRRGLANYLFVDGHVKSPDPSQIEDGTSNGTKYTFAIR